MSDRCSNCQGGTYDACFRTTSGYKFCFVFKDENGDPIDLSGKDFVLDVLRDSRDSTPLIQLTSNPAAGIEVEPGGETGKVEATVQQADIVTVYDAGITVGIWYMTMEPGLGTTEPTQMIGGQVQFRGGN